MIENHLNVQWQALHQNYSDGKNSSTYGVNLLWTRFYNSPEVKTKLAGVFGKSMLSWK